VSRKGGNYSSCTGFYSLDVDDNQFWGRVTALSAPTPQPPPADCRPYVRWYAVLHKFNGWGKHLGTDYWFAGTAADGEREVCERASARLDEMVAALGPVELADIEIELFRVEIDGGVFGLIDVSKPEDGPEFAERALMVPGGLLFYPPWDGTYDT
jgi:formate hydrogenlyase regulatory protein HycA